MIPSLKYLFYTNKPVPKPVQDPIITSKINNTKMTAKQLQFQFIFK